MESNDCMHIPLNGIVDAQKKDFTMSLMDTFKNKVLIPATMVATLVATNPFGGNKTAQARTPVDIAADFNPGGIDDPAPKKTTDGDKIKIPGHDMRGTGKDLEKLKTGAIAMSMQGDMVIFVYIDPRGEDNAIIKGQNDLFIKEIKEAIAENIKAGRKDIKLILADAQPGTRSRLIGVAKGYIGNQVNYDDTKGLSIYIKRGYEEKGYKTHPVVNASSPISYNVNDIAVATNE